VSVSPPRDEASVATRDRVYIDATHAALWGLGINLVLAAGKLTTGILFHSSALIADAFNSIGDVASSLAVRIALHVAQRDEDDDHPFGHTKAESIAGICVALLVTFGAAALGIETLQRLTGSLSIPSWVAGVVAAACGIVKETAYRYTTRAAKRLNSTALQATAWDHRSDALSSAAVAVSLLAAPYLGTLGPYVDPIAGLCVCAFLIHTGIQIFVSTARELMDQQPDPDMVDAIRMIGSEVDHVRDIEKLRVRKSGLEYFIDIHIQVDGELTVAQGHRIGHAVKDRLLAKMPRVRDVHLHVEPFDGGDKIHRAGG